MLRTRYLWGRSNVFPTVETSDFIFIKKNFWARAARPKEKITIFSIRTNLKQNWHQFSHHFSSLSFGLCLCTGPFCSMSTCNIHCCFLLWLGEWQTGRSHLMLQPAWFNTAVLAWPACFFPCMLTCVMLFSLAESISTCMFVGWWPGWLLCVFLGWWPCCLVCFLPRPSVVVGSLVCSFVPACLSAVWPYRSFCLCSCSLLCFFVWGGLPTSVMISALPLPIAAAVCFPFCLSVSPCLCLGLLCLCLCLCLCLSPSVCVRRQAAPQRTYLGNSTCIRGPTGQPDP